MPKQAVFFTAGRKKINPVFSNLYTFKRPVVYKGRAYFSAEALYQSRKLDLSDASTRDFLDAVLERCKRAPVMLKHLVKGTTSFRYPDQRATAADIYARFPVRKHRAWDNAIALKKMKKVAQIKFDHCPEFREALLASGDSELIERNTSDAFWGCGKIAADGVSYAGANEMGKILMALRDNNKN